MTPSRPNSSYNTESDNLTEIPQMNVSLGPDDEKLVEEKLASGQFPSPEAVVSEAFQALRDREELDERERQGIRQLLDERWGKANDPNAKWVDGEEVFARLANKIAQRKQADGDKRS